MLADTKPGVTVTLLNHDTNEQIAVPIRPESITEQIEVNYHRSQVIGLTHMPLQYMNTNNRKLPNVVFQVDQHFAGDMDINQFRYFLLAATVPGAGTAGPPRIGFVWRGFITFTGVITSLQITHERFSEAGTCTGYTATVAFEEWVPRRRTAQAYRKGVY